MRLFRDPACVWCFMHRVAHIVYESSVLVYGDIKLSWWWNKVELLVLGLILGWLFITLMLFQYNIKEIVSVGLFFISSVNAFLVKDAKERIESSPTACINDPMLPRVLVNQMDFQIRYLGLVKMLLLAQMQSFSVPLVYSSTDIEPWSRLWSWV